MNQIIRNAATTSLIVAFMAIGSWLTTGEAQGQYSTVSSAEIPEAQAKSLKRSRVLSKVVSLNRNQIRARPGFKLLKHKKTANIVVIDRSVSTPPKTRIDNDPVWMPDGSLVHYFCACKEQGTDPNQDFCEFEQQGNHLTTCMYKGGGEANCSCQLGVALMDAAGGTEAMVTASGDPW